MRAASIDINTPEFVLDGKDYAEPLTSVPIRSRVGAVAEALTLLEKGAARAELREMAPRPRPGAVSGERAWKIE